MINQHKRELDLRWFAAVMWTIVCINMIHFFQIDRRLDAHDRALASHSRLAALQTELDKVVAQRLNQLADVAEIQADTITKLVERVTGEVGDDD